MASSRQTKGRVKKATKIRDLSAKANKSGRVVGGMMSSIRKKESDTDGQVIGKI